MGRIILIPGIGADKRVFKNIQLPGHEVIGVDMPSPDKSDTLGKYAEKLIIQFSITKLDMVIGNSLGGMLAMEISKQVGLHKTILISSIKTDQEAPGYFTFFRKVPIYKVIPDFMFNSMGFTLKTIFGDMSPADLALFKSMLKNSSPKFMKWAMHAVLHWRNDIVPDQVYHITGNKDLVFDHRRMTNVTIVNGGTHIMIFDRADEINQLLREIIN
jgi:pimeloyl-ACP methyl ester carboxylesterase